MTANAILPLPSGVTHRIFFSKNKFYSFCFSHYFFFCSFVFFFKTKNLFSFYFCHPQNCFKPRSTPGGSWTRHFCWKACGHEWTLASYVKVDCPCSASAQLGHCGPAHCGEIWDALTTHSFTNKKLTMGHDGYVSLTVSILSQYGVWCIRRAHCIL